MGVLNITPDSFSDGGQFFTPDDAVRHAVQMVADGADIIDIGGESTRPATFHDGDPLDVAEELRRVVPVISRLASELPEVPISIDTYKAVVAKRALEEGASIINDISGLTSDPAMAEVAARHDCPLIIMHILGQPRNISEPRYRDVVGDISAFFERQIDCALAAGVRKERIILDPGIGFGKSTKHNLTILNRLAEFKSLGFPIMVGASRKRFIGELLGGADAKSRLEGTSAAVAISIANGADIVRVHDVREIVRVAKVVDAIVRLSYLTPEPGAMD
jgi:dihydropteroate synthase